MNPEQRSRIVSRLALEAGFDRVGIAAAGPLPRADHLRAWLEAGRHGEMEYLRRWGELRADPRKLLAEAKSAIVVAHNYRQKERGAEADRERRNYEADPQASPPTAPSTSELSAKGRIAQYAWGKDYHKIIRRKLAGLVHAMRAAFSEPFEARICVDTAPVLERELAAAAGIGWIGKNTLVLHQELGSFFFLGEVLTTLELAAGSPVADHCGTCTRCLEACPTGALTEPYRMDARRCISYLTIEHRSEIPTELKPAMGEWIYGCDICQQVCPHNRRAPLSREPGYSPRPEGLSPEVPLEEVLAWDQQAYQARLTGSAGKRATLEMWKRNAAIALRNLAPK